MFRECVFSSFLSKSICLPDWVSLGSSSRFLARAIGLPFIIRQIMESPIRWIRHQRIEIRKEKRNRHGIRMNEMKEAERGRKEKNWNSGTPVPLIFRFRLHMISSCVISIGNTTAFSVLVWRYSGVCRVYHNSSPRSQTISLVFRYFISSFYDFNFRLLWASHFIESISVVLASICADIINWQHLQEFRIRFGFAATVLLLIAIAATERSI